MVQRSKIPSKKNLVRQRYAEQFNSCIKGLIPNNFPNYDILIPNIYETHCILFLDMRPNLVRKLFRLE
jgi:hypothetical protein